MVDCISNVYMYKMRVVCADDEVGGRLHKLIDHLRHWGVIGMSPRSIQREDRKERERVQPPRMAISWRADARADSLSKHH